MTKPLLITLSILVLAGCGTNDNKFEMYAKKCDSLTAAFDKIPQNYLNLEKMRKITDSVKMCIDSMKKYNK